MIAYKLIIALPLVKARIDIVVHGTILARFHYFL